MTLDSTGVVVHWSAGPKTVLGYSDAEFWGGPRRCSHIDADRDARTAERELAAAQESDRREVRGLASTQGAPLSRPGNSQRDTDQAGVLTGFVEVIRDLTADQQRINSMFYDLLEAALMPWSSWGRMDASRLPTPKPIGCSDTRARTGRQRGRDTPSAAVPQDAHTRHRRGFFAEPELRADG